MNSSKTFFAVCTNLSDIILLSVIIHVVSGSFDCSLAARLSRHLMPMLIMNEADSHTHIRTHTLAYIAAALQSRNENTHLRKRGAVPDRCG